MSQKEASAKDEDEKKAATDEDLHVDATDEIEDESEEEWMAERLDDIKQDLDSFDPENVAAVGFVVSLKQSKECDGNNCGHEGASAGPHTTDGVTYRAITDDLDGFEDPSNVLGTYKDFDEGLDMIKVLGGEPHPDEMPETPTLGDIFGV